MSRYTSRISLFNGFAATVDLEADIARLNRQLQAYEGLIQRNIAKRDEGVAALEKMRTALEAVRKDYATIEEKIRVDYVAKDGSGMDLKNNPQYIQLLKEAHILLDAKMAGEKKLPALQARVDKISSDIQEQQVILAVNRTFLESTIRKRDSFHMQAVVPDISDLLKPGYSEKLTSP